MNDPTKKNNGLTPEEVAALRRPPGQIIIQWDPNTGNLIHQSANINPVEELGLLVWCAFRRFGLTNDILKEQRIKIADPNETSVVGRVS